MSIATFGMTSTLLPTFGYGPAAHAPIRGCVHIDDYAITNVTVNDRARTIIGIDDYARYSVSVDDEAC